MLAFKRLNKNSIVPEKIDDFSYKLFTPSSFILKPFARISVSFGISFTFKTGNFGVFYPKQSIFSTYGVLSPVKIFNSDEDIVIDFINLAIIGSEINPSNQNLLFGSANDFKLYNGADVGIIKVACCV